MRITSSIGFCLAVVLFSFAGLAHPGNLLYTDHPLVGKIWDMNSRSYVDEAALFARIKTADVLLLGETHDNPWHHDRQQQLLKIRIEPGSRPALMMEQLNAENQQELDQALAGSNREEMIKSVNSLIRFTDWQLYSPLLAIAVDNKLPVIAANVSSQRLQPAIRKGYAAYDSGELKRMAVEEVWSENRQNYLLTQMGGAHCGQLRDVLRLGLTRSHRLRDAFMADSAISSIERGIVAIVGRGHARRDVGLPIYFAARAPSARIISIGFVEVSPGWADPKDYDTESATGESPFDVIWFSPRVERTDPCADYGKPKEAQP
ncbi:MAG: ChaN family lipoprotein [Gallionella sp.]|nr:ChaN family lipoprotein [Gallionella sp.]